MLTPSNSTRRNPTKLCAIFDAGSIAVCKADDKVALHIYTTEGEVLVRMRERDFIASCRGPRDANGHPLRTFEQLDEETRRRAEAQIVERVQQHEAKIGLSDELAEKCKVAWAKFVSGEAVSQADAARAGGVAYVTFNLWVRHNHDLEAKQIRNERRNAGRYTR